MGGEKMNDKCKKCGGEMGLGEAMEMTLSGVPDFPDGQVVTMSYGGPGKLVDCLKCLDCGWSVTI
jgi:ssDNA-binding Zn-finger/Zn-ribbon topoisomerase 1